MNFGFWLFGKIIGSLRPCLSNCMFCDESSPVQCEVCFFKHQISKWTPKKDQETSWINVGVKARLFLHLFASSMFVSLSGWFRLSSATNPEGLAQRRADLQRIGADIGRLLDGPSKCEVACNLHISPARIGLYPTHCLISGMIQLVLEACSKTRPGAGYETFLDILLMR